MFFRRHRLLLLEFLLLKWSSFTPGDAALTINVAVFVASPEQRRSFGIALRNFTQQRDLKLEVAWVSSANNSQQSAENDAIETTASLTAALVDKKIRAIIGSSHACDTVAHLAAAWSIAFVTFDCVRDTLEDARTNQFPTTVSLDTSFRTLSKYVCQLLLALDMGNCYLSSNNTAALHKAFPAFEAGGMASKLNFSLLLAGVEAPLVASGSVQCIVLLGDIPDSLSIVASLRSHQQAATAIVAVIASKQDVDLEKGAQLLASRRSLQDWGLRGLHVVAPSSSSATWHLSSSEKSTFRLIDSLKFYINAIDTSVYDDGHLHGKKVVQTVAGRCVTGQAGYDICMSIGHDYLGNYSVWTSTAAVASAAAAATSDGETAGFLWHKSAAFFYAGGAFGAELRRLQADMTNLLTDNVTFPVSDRPTVGGGVADSYALIVCIVLLLLLVAAAALIAWCEYRRRLTKGRGVGGAGPASSNWLIPVPAIQQFYDVEEVEAICSLDGCSMGESYHMSLCEAEARVGVITDFGYYHDRPVSLKKFSQGAFIVTKAVSRELSYMVSLHHENISTFYGVCLGGDNSPEIILVTEYCIKGSLEEILILDPGKLDDMFVASLMMDLIRGMTFIHESSIGCHGNLKSSNCLVTGRWVLKLADFGLSSLRMKYRSDKSLLWCAPEIIRKTELSSKKADAYSFGVVLYEVIGRKGPIGKGHEMGVYEIKAYLRRVLDESAHPDVITLSCDDYLKNVMLSCWQQNPRQRPDFLSLCQSLKPMRSALKGRSIVDNVLAMMERYQQKLEEQVEARTAQLNMEKRRTEALLYRMLPRQVANQLIANKVVVPEAFACITVLFSDICGFTALAASWSPMEVISLLNDLYTTFDNIISNYDVYKVETVGDAYMVASGLPVPNGDRHAAEIAYMALDFRSALKNFKVVHNDYNGHLQMRIGINSGPCVAGVVGVAMPRYTLFGDTINMASRLETTSEPMRIQCSQETKHLLDNLGGFAIERRGFVTLKGKGDMETFWLVGAESSKLHRAPAASAANGSRSPKTTAAAAAAAAAVTAAASSSSNLQVPGSHFLLGGHGKASSKSSLLSCYGGDDGSGCGAGVGIHQPLYRTMSIRSQNSTCSYSPGLGKPVATVLLKAGSFRKRVYQQNPPSEDGGTAGSAAVGGSHTITSSAAGVAGGVGGGNALGGGGTGAGGGGAASGGNDHKNSTSSELVPLITFNSGTTSSYALLREKS